MTEAIDYTQNTSPVDTDEVLVIDDPSGSWAINRVPISSIRSSINGAVSDGSYSPTEMITGINGGETIDQWDCVYYDTTETEWMIADADASGKAPAWGIAVAATSNGVSASILVRGIVRNSTWDWTPGSVLYLSTTTNAPSSSPSASPSESTPSASPSEGTPSSSPSASPSEGTPSASPVSPSGSPSGSPSASPTSPSGSPSGSPSSSPSTSPSGSPSGSPSSSSAASYANLTETAPSTAGDIVQPVGIAITADIVYFNFNPVSGFGVL